MSQDFKCAIGLHKYETVDVMDIKDSHDLNIGKVYVDRCKNCGKITKTVIYTESNYIR